MSTPKRKNNLSDSAYMAYLSLIADSKWVSKRALHLWFRHPNRRSELIHKLQDEGLITCINVNEKIKEKKRRGKKKQQEMGEKTTEQGMEDVPSYIYGFRYALTQKGREYLSEFNPKKYGRVNDITVDTNEYMIRRIYRLSLLSEMRAMSEHAGFSVHPHTKPFITVLSNHPVSLADRPAFTAFTASEIPDIYNGRENSPINREPFQYYTKSAKRTRYGREYQDAKQYFYRETPIGCIYSLPELIALAEAETDFLGRDQMENDKMRFSRISGVFFSGNGTYRIYNTERTAPKLRVNGEKSMKTFLDAWSANVYKRSLYLYEDNEKGEPVIKDVVGPPQVKGAILFGDSTFAAAISVLKHTLASGLGTLNQKEQGIQNYNLKIIPNTYFIPVIREAIPLYSLCALPNWPIWAKTMGVNYLGSLVPPDSERSEDSNAERSEAPTAERSEAPTSIPQLIRLFTSEAPVDGIMNDGSILLSLPALHLDAIEWMLNDMQAEDNRYTIVAIEWQAPFYDALLETLDPEDAERVAIFYMPQDFLESEVQNYYSQFEEDDAKERANLELDQ